MNNHISLPSSGRVDGSLCRDLTRQSSRFAITLAVTTILGLSSAIAGPVGARVSLSQSIKPVASSMLSAGALTAAELNKKIEFMVPLKMRNYDELVARVHQGEVISQAEMLEKYYPPEADYVAVASWLRDEGFQILKKDPNRLGIFVSGTVTQVQQSLQVNFGRVTSDTGTYVSAITPPSVPVGVMPAILGVNGLQPHIQRHKHSRIISGPITQTANQPPYLTGEILSAYHGSGLTVNGSGQKIGIVIDTFPKTTDLTSFWSRCGVSQTLSNMEFVQVVSGTLDGPSGEESLDVEWTSGIASGAKVRVYASRDLSDFHLDQCYQQILNDLPSNPGLRQISLSYGLGELDSSTSQMQTDAQYFASMAAGGVTVFVSSGDGGSSPDANGGHNGVTQVENPASDPSVTAVGGTSISLNSGGTISSETAWFDSGGGVSSFFNRPSWQTGSGIGAGTKRLVPDVGAAADPSTGGLVILNGSQHQYGGTSWSAPIWAGICALINQARSNAGLPAVGLLGPKVYPLIGTTNFRDITSGNNGGYNAGAGHDLVTGIGTPNIAELIQALTTGGTGGGNQPNLTPYQPNGWSDKIVISTSTGTNVDSANLQPTDTLFVDWSLINNGDAATSATFNVELYVDGSLRQTWTVGPPLAPNDSRSITDFSIGSLGAGTHDIHIRVDSTNTVSESSENDNDFVKTIAIGSNDNFANRQNISGSSGVVNSTNVGATVEGAEPYHAGNIGGASIWYSWTAPASGPVTFDTFQSNFDTLLAVYTGNSLGTLNLVASDDDAASTFQSRVSFNAVVGTTYQIAIDGYNGATGNTALHWTLTQQMYLVSASASPAAGGTVGGGGSYNSGSTVTVTATVNSGYTFSRWTENGNTVSTSPNYTFTVSGNRNLVANFVSNTATYIITVFSTRGGIAFGGGSFPAGSTQTVTAIANRRRAFSYWTENGSIVSTSPSYTFTVTNDRVLIANFGRRRR